MLLIIKEHIPKKIWGCSFLAPPRKEPKESDLRGHFKKACPLKNPLRLNTSRHSKMFRFLNAYQSKCPRFYPRQPPENRHIFRWRIWLERERYIGEGAFAVSASPMPHSLVTFLAEQESNRFRPYMIDRFQFFA